MRVTIMRDIWFCKFCLRQSFIEHDGVNGYCLGCQTPVVRHRTTSDIFHAEWFPVAEVIAGEVSPPAGAALKTLERIDESAPADWQPLLNLAAVAIISVVGGLILREVFSSS